MAARKRRPGAAVTLLDVARHAGVSPMTASRVINKHPYVAEAMREKVIASVKALGYRPNLAGRSLRTSSSALIGVLYSNPSAAYLNQLMLGILEQSSQSGSQALVEKCGDIASQKDATQRLLDAGVDGVILPPPLCDSQATIDELEEANIPVVAIATASPKPKVPSVRIDDYEGALAMTRYLIGLGHRRIALIKGDPLHTPAERRAAAYFDAMAEAGLKVPDECVVEGLFTYQSGLEATRRLLELPERPTAIFSSNDDMAAAAIAVAHGVGLRVPEDVTITGFDDTPVATTVWPELTTIHQPVAEMGRAAVTLIVNEVRRRRAGGSPSADAPHQLMEYSLIQRGSAARPPVS